MFLWSLGLHSTHTHYIMTKLIIIIHINIHLIR